MSALTRVSPAPCPALTALVAGFTGQINLLRRNVEEEKAGKVRAEGQYDNLMELFNKLRIAPQLVE